MRKRTSFWTQDNLKELHKIFHNHTLQQLEKRYGKKKEDIIQAYEFQCAHKRLLISQKRKKGVLITIYAPAFAEGSVISHNDDLHV